MKPSINAEQNECGIYFSGIYPMKNQFIEFGLNLWFSS